MKWVWQQKDWSDFEFDEAQMQIFEAEFNRQAGIVTGSVMHLENENVDKLKIELLTQEALSTSGIEGEILKRESVQSSIRKNLGLQTSKRNVQAKEAGIGELMVDLYNNYEAVLSHKVLYNWHAMINNGRRDLEVIGGYRQHKEVMQIVGGNLTNQKVFYEAPPSDVVKKEMTKFIKWYNDHIDDTTMPALLFAGIAHIYFEIIHPFEDGNGRIGRALVEKSISQKLKTPALNSFSKVIEKNKKEYYSALQSCNHSNDITKWLTYFCKTIINAQKYTIETIGFIINKNKFFNKYDDQLNARQIKVLLRIFEEGPEGFKGGLSAGNYKAITAASPATVTRDLQELVSLAALTKEGELKHSRYYLNLYNL